MTETNNSSNKQPKFGTAFLGVAGGDWAIVPEKLRSIVEVVTRTNDLEAFRSSQEQQEKAVQCESGEYLEGARRATVRNGVAIIPVRGSIMRFGGWMSDFSGGTSVDTLARDLEVALNNANVFSILFDIHSPGGEVTGINELCDRIFAARKRKPMTAYVGGMGCSAAYWIASAVGDIAIDETAILGSIGVMAVYTDDSKYQEKVGIEDIEFISSQSPYKNAPPTTDEGKKRIQARVDALAQVFIEKVARNRDEQVSNVLKNYGQGDVLVGENAIKAGLADRFSSFEETLQQLAEAHTPGYQKSSFSASDILPSTLISESDLGSQIAQTEPDNTALAKENTSEPLDSEPDGDTEEKKKKENDMNKENSGAAPAAETEKENLDTAAAAAPAVDAAQFAELQRQLAEAQAALKSKDEAIAQAAIEARDKRLGDIAKNLPGEFAKQESFLKDLATAFGEDSAQFKAYVANQTALKNQIDTGALFSEAGAGGANPNSAANAEEKLDQMAKERAKTDGCSYEKAYSLVIGENTSLYAQYEAEQQPQRSE
ncbi:MAG: S49 family peptidase [Acidobacteriota bacterium]|nr:S49 family peptidase [Acidobacteriota bacterium]